MEVILERQIELRGEAADIAELKNTINLAGLDDLRVAGGQNGESFLSGSRFAACTTDQAAMDIAKEAIANLNGLASINWRNFHPVRTGQAVYRLHGDGRKGCTVFVEGVTVRSRAGTVMAVTRANDGSETVVSSDDSMKRILSQLSRDTRFKEIVLILGKEPTWQRLRFVFEKLDALSGGGHALWQKGYADRDEVESFKKNVEDPRHSGIDAVHGVPQGPFKGTKMSIEAGRDFIVRLLKTVLEREA